MIEDFNLLKPLICTTDNHNRIVPHWIPDQDCYVISQELLAALIQEINAHRRVRIDQ